METQNKDLIKLKLIVFVFCLLHISSKQTDISPFIWATESEMT